MILTKAVPYPQPVRVGLASRPRRWQSRFRGVTVQLVVDVNVSPQVVDRRQARHFQCVFLRESNVSDRLHEGGTQFYVMAHTYNTYGGHPTLSLISDFLAGDADDFGSAMSELTVNFHFPPHGPTSATLEQGADFHTNRQTLPKVSFSSAQRGHYRSVHCQ